LMQASTMIAAPGQAMTKGFTRSRRNFLVATAAGGVAVAVAATRAATFGNPDEPPQSPEGISMTQHSQQSTQSPLVDTADFAARDERIRCRSYAVVRKLAGLPQDLFASYWRDRLGPLLARLPGVGYYVQHHFSQDHRANLWPLAEGVHRMDVVLDGAVEVGFADIEGQNRYVKASPVLSEDTLLLFEHAVAYNLRRGHIR
jgi:hypothetical protein